MSNPTNPALRTDEVEILPCPFCGEPPKVRCVTIACENPECFGPKTTAGTLFDSAVQWGRRASQPRQGELTEGDATNVADW